MAVIGGGHYHRKSPFQRGQLKEDTCLRLPSRNVSSSDDGTRPSVVPRQIHFNPTREHNQRLTGCTIRTHTHPRTYICTHTDMCLCCTHVGEGGKLGLKNGQFLVGEGRNLKGWEDFEGDLGDIHIYCSRDYTP